MKTDRITLRPARPADAPALAEIYRPYVEETAITFELEPPTAEEFARRIETVSARFPYFVAEEDDRPVGYAYAGPFRTRAAYGWCAELSVYLAPAAQGKGLGRRLVAAMEEALLEMGILRLYSCVTVADGKNPALPGNSLAFHQHLGFRLVGEFPGCGYKFGRWFGVAWLEKPLAELPAAPAPVRPYPEILRGKERKER